MKCTVDELRSTRYNQPVFNHNTTISCEFDVEV